MEHHPGGRIGQFGRTPSISIQCAGRQGTIQRRVDELVVDLNDPFGQGGIANEFGMVPDGDDLLGPGNGFATEQQNHRVDPFQRDAHRCRQHRIRVMDLPRPESDDDTGTGFIHRPLNAGRLKGLPIGQFRFETGLDLQLIVEPVVVAQCRIVFGAQLIEFNEPAPIRAARSSPAVLLPVQIAPMKTMQAPWCGCACCTFSDPPIGWMLTP